MAPAVSPPTRLLLIRHGETEGAVTARFHGRSDVPLSSLGERQMEALAEILRDHPLAAIYASDLDRSVRSAEIVARPHGLDPMAEPAFREIDMGRWEGLTWEEIKARDSDRAARWCESPGVVSFPGGESVMDVRARLMPALEKMLDANRGQTVALVAHGGTNRLILCEAMGMPPARLFAIGQDFASLSLLDWHAEGPVVLLMNDTCHLRMPPGTCRGG